MSGLGMLLCLIGIGAGGVISVNRKRYITAGFLLIALIGFVMIGVSGDKLEVVVNTIINDEIYQHVPLKGKVVITEQIQIVFDDGKQMWVRQVRDSVTVEKVIEKK